MNKIIDYFFDEEEIEAKEMCGLAIKIAITCLAITLIIKIL